MEKKYKVSFTMANSSLEEGETVEGMKSFLETQEGVSDVSVEEVIPAEAPVEAVVGA